MHKFREFHNNVSRSSFRGLVNAGCLSTIAALSEAATAGVFWHGESKCTARHLKSDGLALLTQANGQVCFLHLYHGNTRISIMELEEMCGIADAGNSEKSYELF